MKDKINEESNSADAVHVVVVTFPNLETARQIGTHLVESQLAACINLIPAVESIYRWEGEVTADSEVVGLIKSTFSNLFKLEAELLQKHPYDTPEFLVLKADGGSSEYLKWIADSCS